MTDMSDATRRPERPTGTTGTTADADDGGQSPLVAAHPQPTDTGTDDARTPSGATDTEDIRTPSGPHGTPGTTEHRLLPHDDCDKLAAQLQHAVAGFVDAPRDAVREADQILQELTERVTHAITERRRTLRRSWQSADTGEGGTVAATDTEQLRLALRDYRELAERLLHM